MDIRKYFSTPGASKTTPKPAKTSKQKAVVISSDEDDNIVLNTPEASKNKITSITQKKRKVHDLDSDSEDFMKKSKSSTPKKVKTDRKANKKDNKAAIISSSDSEPEKDSKTSRNKNKPSKTSSESSLKPVNVFEAFNTPISQAKVELPKKAPAKVETPKKISPKAKPKQKEILSDDDEFDKTLELLDDEELIRNAITTPKANKRDSEKVSKTPSSSENKTPSRKRKISENDKDIVEVAQEKHEKKQYTAMLYQKYLNRSGPAHHGSKEIPEGKPDCLKNVCFLITGVLDSLDRTEAEDLIKKHGGRTVHAISKKVNYLIKGEDAGPAKLSKAESYSIPILEEDDLLNMIRERSGLNKSDESKDLPADQTIITSEYDERKSKKKSVDNSNKRKIDSPDKSTSAEKYKIKASKQEIKTETKIIKNEKDENSPGKKENVSPKNIVKEDKKKVKKIIDVETWKNEQEKKIATSSKAESSNKAEEISSKKIKSEIKKEDISSSAQCSQNSAHSLAWVDKYKPNDINRIVGQQGENSCVKKLETWLKHWYKNQNGKTKLIRPSPWAKNDNGAFFKAALLSGPPGIGKTTTAALVSKQLGYDIVEFNASDTRNKKLIHDEIGQILNTTSISSYFKGEGVTSKKHVLIMDEVDGMSGNEDRGGMQELVNLIKTTSIPIICICNDRNHQKIRSLANYCFDLRFNKPRMEQIRGALMTICFQEDISIKPNILAEIINGTGLDIRQSINNLYMWTMKDKGLSLDEAQKSSKSSQKDDMITPWEVVKKVFTIDDQKKMDIGDRSRLFFHDYSIGPLFVFENYLHVQPEGCTGKLEKVIQIAKASESLSRGDVIESSIRSSNNWSLLEVQAMYSSVLPGYYMAGHFRKQINFPSWLGKNSRKNKFSRIHSELRCHMSKSISGSKQALHLDYAKYVRNGIITPLIKKGIQGVEESVDFMQSYNLIREDLDNLVEITQMRKRSNPFDSIDSKVKAAFTRAYNKQVMVPYTITSAVVKKKTIKNNTNEFEEDEDALEEDFEDDKVENDAMITAKKANKNNKARSSSKTSEKGKNLASSSKGATSSKGKKKSKK